MVTGSISRFLDSLRRAVLLREGDGATDGRLLDAYVRLREEASFAALVQRHGPMVWGVCRRLLSNPADAEDAFQATFLILVRKAASIVPREMVANWLYGVANNVCRKARAVAGRRRARERQVETMPEPEAVERDLWHELEPLLDQELAKLPDKYRAAIVLCDLEGKSRREAARLLDIPEGTLSSRLTTGRTLLAKRLVRHGLTVSGGLLGTVLSQGAASAGVPAAVVSSTIKAAGLFAAGQAAAGSIPAKVTALVDGGLKIMLASKLKPLTAVVLLSVLVCALGNAVGILPKTTGGAHATPVVLRPKNRLAANLPAPKKKVTPKLEGTWAPVKGEIDGHPLSPLEMETNWVIKGDKIIWEGAGKKAQAVWTFTIDPNRKPPEIDLRMGRQSFKGIYKLDEGSLAVCFGMDRPSEFKAGAGSKHTLLVLKRRSPKDGGGPPKPKVDERPTFHWGKVADGLQAGISLDPDRKTHKYGDEITLRVRVRNVGKQKTVVAFLANEIQYQHPRLAEGTAAKFRAFTPAMPFWERPIEKRVLKPDQELELGFVRLKLVEKEPAGPVDVPWYFLASAGRYTLSYVGFLQSHPALATGQVKLNLRGEPVTAVEWAWDVLGLPFASFLAGMQDQILPKARKRLMGEAKKP